MVFYESQKTLSTGSSHACEVSDTKAPGLAHAFKGQNGGGGDLSFIKKKFLLSSPPFLLLCILLLDTKPITQVRKLPKLGYHEVMSSGYLWVGILPAWTAGCAGSIVTSDEDATKFNSDLCPMPPVTILRRTTVT